MDKFIKKITDFLFRFGKDRYIHFILSLILTQLLTAILLIAGLSNWSIFIGPAAVIVLGFLKEFYDEKKGEGFEPYDVVWDFLGVFTALVLMILVVAGFGV